MKIADVYVKFLEMRHYIVCRYIFGIFEYFIGLLVWRSLLEYFTMRRLKANHTMLDIFGSKRHLIFKNLSNDLHYSFLLFR